MAHSLIKAILFASLAGGSVAAPAAADPLEWLGSNFIDPDDGALDVSAWLSRGGFFPVPVVVSEPAVDNGLGLVGVFVHGGDDEAGIPPDVSGGGAIFTGNSSSVYVGFHQGSYLGDRLRYFGAIGDASVNLDTFPGSSGTGFGFNVDGLFSLQNVRYRVADSDVFAGARWTYLDSSVKFDAFNAPAGENPNSDIRLSGLGASLYYDTRDNIFTTTEGINARALVTFYDNKIGSDFDFVELDLTGLFFHSPFEKWNLSAKAEVSMIFGDAPFFAEPFIQLRGIPALRYQGEAVVSTEVELRRDISPRWSVLGFAGVGFAGSDGVGDFSDEGPQGVVGGGVRYNIARELGLLVGLDVAQGTEDTVVYLQFGHAFGID